MTLAIGAVLLATCLWYALAGRRWLKRQPWARGFFAWVEPIEIALYQKSETILVGRLLWAGGSLVTLYDTVAVMAAGLDWTPLTTRLFDALRIPDDMRGIVATGLLAGVGLLINWLRKRTTKPIDVVAQKEGA